MKPPVPPVTVFRAYAGDGKLLGVVAARSEDVANAFFVGRGDIPHSMSPVDLTNLALGLVVICTTSERRLSDFPSRDPSRTVRTVD